MIIYNHLIYIDGINGNGVGLTKKLGKFAVMPKSELR